MSSDTGPRKRVKDKKRKKGGAGDLNRGLNIQREAPAVKLMMDETIHVHKEADFGGSVCSKLVFTTLILLIGAALLFVLSSGKDSEDLDKNSSDTWFSFSSLGPLFAESEDKQTVDYGSNGKSSDDNSLLDKLWLYVPFGGDEHEINDDNEKVSSKEVTNEEDHDDVDREIDEEDSADNDEDDKTPDEDEDRESKDDDNDGEEGDKEEESYDQDEYNRDIDDDREDDESSTESNYEVEYRETDDDLDKSEEEEDDDNQLLYSYSSEAPKEFNNEDMRKYYGSEDKLRQEDNDYDDDGNDKNDEDDDNMSEIESSSERTSDDTEASEDETKNKPEVTEPSIANVVMKLGVGLALVFVAYSVIIRKWNDYEDLVPVLVEQNENEGQEAAENVEQEGISQDDERSYLNRNEIAQEHSDKASVRDEIKESTMNYSNSGADILAHEIEDSETPTSESETEPSETDSNDAYYPYMPTDYNKENITNQYDSHFKDELDDADEAFNEGQIKLALAMYRNVLRNHPHSVRAKYGVAKSLDTEAELHKSNKLLAEVIDAYVNTLLTPDVPDPLLKLAASRAVDRMRFKGEYENCIWIQNFLIHRFPDEVSYHIDLVVTLLMLNRISEAKEKLEKILFKWPNNGLALVHYGFVLKLAGNVKEAVTYLDRGIKTNEKGTQDGRFYFHLGDALQRLKRHEDARKIYRKGVEKGLFLSEFQRSLYNVNRLTGRPWWTLEQTTYQSFFRELEANWIRIRDEAVSVMDARMFINETEQLREMGAWKQYEMFSRGRRLPQCHKTPITCELIGKFEPAAGCRRGQAKFSIILPGTHVWPHCGPTNCRLRAHLGLIVPANVSIRVAEESRFWKEGEVFVFDDSFEHEIWHNGTSLRLILIVDVWHPELNAQERKTLTSI